jgi:excisionase family DNA binding protein
MRGEIRTVEKYLTVSETAEYLNTSERFVRRLVAERRIAFHHVGRHVQFSLSDLDAWLVASRVEPLTPEMIWRDLHGAA